MGAPREGPCPSQWHPMRALLVNTGRGAPESQSAYYVIGVVYPSKRGPINIRTGGPRTSMYDTRHSLFPFSQHQHYVKMFYKDSGGKLLLLCLLLLAFLYECFGHYAEEQLVWH